MRNNQARVERIPAFHAGSINGIHSLNPRLQSRPAFNGVRNETLEKGTI